MRWYRDFLPNASEDLNGFFRPDDRAAGTALSRAPASQKDVRCGVVLHRAARGGRRGIQTHPRVRLARAPRPSTICLFRRSRALSTDFIHPDTSGTGAQTSSTSFPMRRLPSTSNTPRSCPPCNAPCTFTPSTARRTALAKTKPPGAYRDATWGSVIVGVDPDPHNAGTVKNWLRGLLGRGSPLFGGRRLRQHDDGRGGKNASKRPTATTMRGWPRSRASTTPRTSFG